MFRTSSVHRFAAVLAAAALIAVGAMANGVAGFRDVLDTPATSSPLAAKGLVNALARAGTQRIVAAGQRGHVLVSDDEARTWQQAQVPVSSDLVALHFADAQRGWAAGHDGVILHTADGGLHWTKQRDGRPDAADVPLLDVWFADAHEGYAVGAFGLALRTTDGGAHWEKLAKDALENPKDLHLYAIRRLGDDVWIAGEQGLLLKREAATGRFRAVATPYPGTFFGITGAGRTLVAHGLRGNAVRSIDGGATWQKLDTGVAAGLTASAVDRQGRVLLASQAGSVLASAEDGASFRPLALATSAPPAAALLPLPSGDLLVAGPRGLQRIAPR